MAFGKKAKFDGEDTPVETGQSIEDLQKELAEARDREAVALREIEDLRNGHSSGIHGVSLSAEELLKQKPKYLKDVKSGRFFAFTEALALDGARFMPATLEQVQAANKPAETEEEAE